MITIQIPSFDEKLKFTGFKNIKVKNKVDHSQAMKIYNALPGSPCGYCPAVYQLGKSAETIEIRSFYDGRQRGINKLRNFFITVLK